MSYSESMGDSASGRTAHNLNVVRNSPAAWNLLMRMQWPLLSLFLPCLLGCSPGSEEEPSGPIARLGTTPTIDGVLEPGEWDDAEIVTVGTVEQFRIKHDGVNLYFGLRAGGGDLRFNTETGLRVLHWSAQLGSAEYTKSDPFTLSLDRPFSWELWGLRHESPAVIRETLARYLAENGWASSTASMGNVMESELVVSLDWLGVNTESGRFVEIPSVRMGVGLLISRDDPRAEELFAMSLDERRRQYPSVSWPADSMPNDSITMGKSPDTIRIDPADFGRIWIDLRGRDATEH